jgi:NitT/TauT family transport system substrate-binding protein
MISKGEVITDLNTLKGKVVFNISENGSPDLVFKHILTENDIEYTSEYQTGEDDLPVPILGKVILAYKPAAELIPAIKQNKIEYGILGEPAITNALNVIGEPAKVVLDMQEEWADVTGLGRSYAQACLVVNSEFLSANEAFVNDLIAALALSDDYLTGDDSETNIALAKTSFRTYAASTSLANITKDTVIRSNVETVAAVDAKDDIIAYLSAIYALNPAALGNAMPDDGFYYIG